MKYDYLIVGSGLYGSVFAHEAHKKNKKCLVIDKRSHLGGNIYTETIHDIPIHRYGAHIFHTNDTEIWNYVTSLCQFNNFINSPIAKFKNKIYNLPFNMNTFYQLWGCTTPDEAKNKIKEQTNQIGYTLYPKNLEEQAISLVGRDLYDILIKGYTEKQWGRPCSQLPASIIKRLPVRFTYDNNYFKDKHQGVPINGYTDLILKLLEGIEVKLNTNFNENRAEFNEISKKIIFTGPIDEYFGYSLGYLEYRSLTFENQILNQDNYQGVAVVNYTDKEIPYTRIIEHKHFTFGQQRLTVITREYPCEWSPGKEAYYPINSPTNQNLYNKYKELANTIPKIHFGGRLGQYKYLDMDKVIKDALAFSQIELKN